MRCIYDVFGREITKYKVMHGVDIQLWPTLFHNCESKPGRTTYQLHSQGGAGHDGCHLRFATRGQIPTLCMYIYNTYTEY